MKVEDPKKRRRLAEQVARGELTLVKLREKIEGRRTRPTRGAVVEVDDDAAEEAMDEVAPEPAATAVETRAPEADEWADGRKRARLSDDSLVNAKQQLAEAVEDLVDVLRDPDVRHGIGSVDRANLAKYLTIAKLRLENAIAMVRSDDPPA